MWIFRSHYRLLLKQLARAEHRVQELEGLLAIERSENRRSERHWANMFLRSKLGANSFPLPAQPAKAATPAGGLLEPVPEEIDPGELEALVAAGEAYGVSALEAENMLRAQRGLPLKSPVQ